MLTFGNWEDVKEITPANLFKDKIKVYGIIFGKILYYLSLKKGKYR